MSEVTQERQGSVVTGGAALAGSTSAARQTQMKVAASRAGDFEAQEAALAPVQRHGGKDDATSVHAAAAHGISGSGGAMPHGSTIQKAFGGYDISHVQAHTDAAAAAGSAAMGANAYATGNHVAFNGAPDLHTAAHEAAHVVQQQAGVQLSGGVGKVGDAYEQHADRVADAVVAGKDAAPVLAEMAGGGGSKSSVQQRAVQREETPTPTTPASSGQLVHPTDEDSKQNPNPAKPTQSTQEILLEFASKPTEHPMYQTYRGRILEVFGKLDASNTADVEKRCEELFATFLRAMAATEKDTDALKIQEGDADHSTTNREMNAGRVRLGQLDPVAKTADGRKFEAQFAALKTALTPFLNKQIEILKPKSFAFWSGSPGRQIAAKHGADLALESSAFGFIFDGLNLTGDWDMQLWAMMSAAYGEAVAKNVAGKQIRNFLGRYAAKSDGNNIFGKIESPLLKAKLKDGLVMTTFGCAPLVTWSAEKNDVVVDTNQWDPTQNAGGIEGCFTSGVDVGGTFTERDAIADQVNAWTTAKIDEVKAANQPPATPPATESEATPPT